MKQKPYLLITLAITIFIGIAFANMHPGDTKKSNNSLLPDKETVIQTKPAEDMRRGKLLYENHCISCHSTNVHSRSDNKVKSINDIKQWVIRWSDNLGLEWGSDDIDIVSDYLNQQFYHFSPKQ